MAIKIEMWKAIEEQLREKGEIRKDDRIRLLDEERLIGSGLMDVLVGVVRDGDCNPNPYGTWELIFDDVRGVIC